MQFEWDREKAKTILPSYERRVSGVELGTTVAVGVGSSVSVGVGRRIVPLVGVGTARVPLPPPGIEQAVRKKHIRTNPRGLFIILGSVSLDPFIRKKKQFTKW